MALSCPRCTHPLQATLLEGVELDYCRRCGGTFLDVNEPERVFGPALDAKSWWDHPIRRTAHPSQLLCPKDGQAFEEQIVGPDRDQVLVDYCPHCRGLWLDVNEGKRLRNIVLKAGQNRDASWVGRPGIGSYLFQLFSGFPMEVWNPVRRVPVVTIVLVAILAAVFAIQVSASTPGPRHPIDGLVSRFAMVPEQVRHGRALWTIFTSIFLHASLLHLLGNCYFLWVFGDNVEGRLGGGRYGLLFVGAGLIGMGAQALYPGDLTVHVLGASGAVAGMMGAYVVLFPGVKLYQILFFYRFRIPAVYYLAFWFVLNALMAVGGVPGVGWFAHLGGFVAGVLLALVCREKSLSERLASRGTEADRKAGSTGL